MSKNTIEISLAEQNTFEVACRVARSLCLSEMAHSSPPPSVLRALVEAVEAVIDEEWIRREAAASLALQHGREAFVSREPGTAAEWLQLAECLTPTHQAADIPRPVMLGPGS